MNSYFFLSTKVRVCCDFRDKSARILWFSRQKNAYVVIFETKVPTLWFLQQKCAYVVIFTTTIVFLVFLVQTPVFPKFLVPTLAQFIGSCQQKTVNKGLFRFWEKSKVLWNSKSTGILESGVEMKHYLGRVRSKWSFQTLIPITETFFEPCFEAQVAFGQPIGNRPSWLQSYTTFQVIMEHKHAMPGSKFG